MTETYAMVQPGPQSRRGSSGPMSDAQAIELLSGHPDSEEFIQEYRRWRAMQPPNVVEALILTGEAFSTEHRRGQPPN